MLNFIKLIIITTWGIMSIPALSSRPPETSFQHDTMRLRSGKNVKKAQNSKKRKAEKLPDAPSCSRWMPRAFDVDVTIQKMLKNRSKTVEEHRAKEKQERSIFEKQFVSAYPALKEVPLTLQEVKEAKIDSPLSLTYMQAEDIGPRSAMEDAHFFIEIPQGYFTGVLDGHNGKAVANFASKELQMRFPQALLKTNGNIHQAFEAVIHEVHEAIIKIPAWNSIGSTCVLCFIDREKGLIYTATLGDSEANIYRVINRKLKSIPLSCVRDWTSKKDEVRAIRAIKDLERRKLFLDQKDAKMRRFPMPLGINVSRALGYKNSTNGAENPAVIHKPKITVEKLKKGDILTLACDGLKDYALEEQIVNQVAAYIEEQKNVGFFENFFLNIGSLFSQNNKLNNKLAKQLVDLAIARNAQDNVTVIAFEVE